MNRTPTAKHHLDIIRNDLAMPPRIAKQWEALHISERKVLLQLAGIPRILATQGWFDFTLEEQTDIRDAAKRASSWALKLEL